MTWGSNPAVGEPPEPPKRVEFEHHLEWRDIWLGLFWDRRADGLHIYLCLVPCYVLHWRLS